MFIFTSDCFSILVPVHWSPSLISAPRVIVASHCFSLCSSCFLSSPGCHGICFSPGTSTQNGKETMHSRYFVLPPLSSIRSYLHSPSKIFARLRCRWSAEFTVENGSSRAGGLAIPRPHPLLTALTLSNGKLWNEHRKLTKQSTKRRPLMNRKKCRSLDPPDKSMNYIYRLFNHGLKIARLPSLLRIVSAYNKRDLRCQHCWSFACFELFESKHWCTFTSKANMNNVRCSNSKSYFKNIAVQNVNKHTSTLKTMYLLFNLNGVYIIWACRQC